MGRLLHPMHVSRFPELRVRVENHGTDTRNRCISKTTNTEFVFAVCSTSDEVPTEVAVRRLLKRLGRSYGLRVTWPTPATTAPESQPRPKRRATRSAIKLMQNLANQRVGAPPIAPPDSKNRIGDSANGVCSTHRRNKQRSRAGGSDPPEALRPDFASSAIPTPSAQVSPSSAVMSQEHGQRFMGGRKATGEFASFGSTVSHIALPSEQL